jgi:hypothetical protein
VLIDRNVLVGRTVHIVPAEGGQWHVADLQGNVSTFSSRTAAVEQAKRIAAASQPSQVVLLDTVGDLVPVARYQLPQYPLPHFEEDGGISPFEAAVKALVIGGFIAAGAKVLGDLVKKFDDENTETSKSENSKRRKSRTRFA